ncbi:serine hydrolase [Variovorax sp. J22R133]|uniref:serine hydrolase n=1 Tax=Variovorax brevis TaxID=3053503 RepID=UPI002578EF81|nr:serine hydrolase [Variovorax sp. J22R133]MDM0115017.1 serine hydrolase [Variovorax sp. J22R133]
MTTGEKLEGFDAFMEKALADWNAPGIGIGVVQNDELVFAKGYGFRDYGARLPFTPSTLFPIASNTKLFTAVAAGFLVEEGLLAWDTPIREAVPSIRFSTELLNSTVTLRDMLAHRTGINRHDSMWFRSELSRKELFERLKFMAPSDPLRQNFVYNNVMYAAVGHIIELLTGQSWEQVVQQRLLDPLGMRDTVFTLEQMRSKSDFAVPWTERRDHTELFELPPYRHMIGAGPAGGLNSNLQDMARWLICLMGDGKLGDRQVIPASVLKATLAPSMAIPNHMLEMRGFKELLNSTYGMGRHTSVYRGHLMTFHGGSLGGFYSQVSYLPNEKTGVITFVTGHHCAVLADLLTYNLHERLLGLDTTPWSERFLPIMQTAKQSATVARTKATHDHVPGTRPTHSLDAYEGGFEHAVYPALKIGRSDAGLTLAFRDAVLPLAHVHYNRFDTADDEVHGKWSVNFSVDPQGAIESLTVTLDEAEAMFRRRAPTVDAATAQLLVGTYQTASGFKCKVVQKQAGQLYFVEPGSIDRPLNLYRDLAFRSPSFSNVIYAFTMDEGRVTGVTVKTPSGEFPLSKI